MPEPTLRSEAEPLSESDQVLIVCALLEVEAGGLTALGVGGPGRGRHDQAAQHGAPRAGVA
jgi:hypothetical protein